MGALSKSLSRVIWLKDLEKSKIRDLQRELDEIESKLTRLGADPFHPQINEVLDALVELDEIPKVVVVGTDPYKDPKRATGIPFSVCDDYKGDTPRSLLILKKCLGIKSDCRKWLIKWMNANRVLLLNSSLTYQKRRSFKLWRRFIEMILKEIIDMNPSLQIWLMGSRAKTFAKFLEKQVLNEPSAQIFTSCHPSLVHCVEESCPCYDCFKRNWDSIMKNLNTLKQNLNLVNGGEK